MKSKNSFRMFKVLSVLSVLSIQMLSPNALAQSLDDKFNAEVGITELELETAAADSTSVALPILNLNNEVTVTSDETEEVASSKETSDETEEVASSEETDEVASTETEEEETVEIVVVEDEGFGDGMEVTDSETSDETDEVASTEEGTSDEVVIVEDLTTDEEDRDIATVEDDEIEEELTVEERFGKLDTNLEGLTDNKQNLLAELAESTESRENKVSKIEAHNTSVNMELTLANELNTELAEDHERKEDVQNIIKFFEDTLIDLESEEVIALLDSENTTDNVAIVEDEEEEEEEVNEGETDEVVDLAAENNELHQLVCDQRDQISDLTSQIESLRAGVTPYEGMMNSMMQLMMMNQMMMMQSMNQQPLYDRAGTPVDTMGQMMAPMMMMQSMSMGMQNAYLGMMSSGSAYGLGMNPGHTYNVQGDFYGRDYSMVQNPAALTGQTNTLAMPNQFPYRDFRFGQIVSDNRSPAVDTQAGNTASTEDNSASDERVSTDGMVN